MTAAEYFWLVDHNDWSRCFAISSPQRIWSSSFSFIGGIAKKKTAKLRHLILLSRVTYWAPLEMLVVLMPRTPYLKVKWSSTLLWIVNSTSFFSFLSFHLIHCNQKVRVQKSYSPYTSDRGPCQLMRSKSISHLQTPILSRFGLSSCFLTDLFGI
jgi:hypothetical protein